ncbi:uncharacterized protein TRIADDRAFT_49771 [Trichoplax adhaerens]|uniref:GPI alpha-1,4-mannosyltransferase I, catalytic subunit n=1 Tax=Trichoplax adhaerens TaxID=10228 RepID=B3RIQ9_TRIAD|nr:hypothetical protein TRIADDRAFT_49771 [Trichoplax adhaerens]EDV29023.1 hypothetical protein TRIADDRAFT_49771 [Trichoplax adhaerens]|eukprot:XP_002108225.1 hypothetical protein TRIADDRAFT_49771 [Trichoplax adhaerens]
MSPIIKYSLVAGILRLFLIMYGEWQDKYFVVKYTDVDYKVFTDAARYVANGESPYQRATYRYTPLLAWILVPATTLRMSYGKLLFSGCDILSGWLIFAILSIKKVTDSNKIICTNLWLFNPLTITVSTRGNAESLLCVLVLSSIYFMLERRTTMSAFSLALAIHFKLYPVIYTLPLLLSLHDIYYDSDKVNYHYNIWLNLLWKLTRFEIIKFISIWLLTLIAINGLMYCLYGLDYIQEAYLYHLTRVDTRHNFSLYFYMMYINVESWLGSIISRLAFIPQLILMLIISLYSYTDICFCMFVQTFAFVTFNKVCTSQYFLWYLSLLPLVLANNRLLNKPKYSATLGITWFLSQVVWLFFAYLVEFKGKNTFVLIWIGSILHFFVNIFVLAEVIRHHRIGFLLMV